MRKRLLLVLLLVMFVPVREQPLRAPAPQPHIPITRDAVFPSNFIFGAAGSDRKTTKDGTQFLSRYKEDFRLAGQIGIPLYRLSLDWRLIEPVEGQWNWKAVIRYRDMIRTGRRYGMELMPCLSHDRETLPEWFLANGGLENPDAPKKYARYARFVARNIGIPCRITWWLTLNEPQVMLIESYPVKDFRKDEEVERFMRVGGILLEMHRRAYHAIHWEMRNYGPVHVGFASAPWMFYPGNKDSKLDTLVYTVFNIASLMMDYLGGSERDFIGLNYYGYSTLRVRLNMTVETQRWDSFDGRPTKMYPRALYDMIMKYKDLHVPIIITENGINDEHDQWREEYIVVHLKAVHDAIRDGADVIGYTIWSLTGAYEWVDKDKDASHWGLITIDRPGLKQRIQPSAFTYGDIIKHHRIPTALLEKYHASLP